MNIVTKNVRKSTETGVAAAVAMVVAKVVCTRGWIPADCEPYVVIAVAGICSGIYDFVRHTKWKKAK